MKSLLKLVVFVSLFLLNSHLYAQVLRTATATASTYNGFIVGVTINDGGAGYTYPPGLSFVGVGSGAGAYTVISNGAVTQIVITNAGTGYTTLPSVVISAPSTLLYSLRSGTAYVTVPDSASLDSTTNQLTIECWFSAISYAGDWYAMVSKEDSTYNLTGYFFGGYSTTVRPIIDTSPLIYDGSTILNNSNPTFPAWHHLAVQYNQTNYSVWLDGSSIYSTNAKAQIILGSNPLTIGCQNSGYRPFVGNIDEVRISKVVRYTSSFRPQIRFNADSNTIALYHFDEGSGTVVHDSSGNGNDGVITGSAAWSTNTPVSPPIISISKAVYLNFSNLAVGTNYQVQVSTNLGGTWSNYGVPFTATNLTMTYSNYWNVSDWNQLYFRLSQ
jgi:hypothetical protein